MRVPSRLQVSGPLAEYADGFREELLGQGYQQTSAANHLYLLAHMSRWMVNQGFNTAELTPARVEEFLRARRADGYVIRLSQRGVAPLLGYLRGLGVVPTPPGSVSAAPVELLVESYSNYLASERGLAAGTVCRYASIARLFLSDCERPAGLDVGCLTAGDVTAFVVRHCRSRPVASAKMLVTGLRSLLRFLLVEGYTDRHLAPAVLTTTGWAGGSLPQALSPEAVAGLLASCDQHTEVGLRDFAILTVLHRLGLRAGEVATLALADVDWRHGEIVVRGKGSRRERLPADVGEAMVAYLHQRRRSACRTLFLRVRAPIGGLTSDGVADAVRGACLRSGLPSAGPHRLRHSAATAMVAGGATLAGVGQVLRHARLATTAIYAKVDRTSLRSLARPWPGGAR